MLKTVIFQSIQFIISKLFSYNPYIGRYQMLQHRDRVDLGVMTKKDKSSFPKALALLEHRHLII